MMNAELTAENRPACEFPGSVFSAECGNSMTHENEGRIQVLIVLPCVIFVKLFRFPPINGEEVGPQVVGPQWVEELLEGRMEAGLDVRDRLATTIVG